MEKIFEELTKKIRTKEELIFYLEKIAKAKQLIFQNKESFSLSKKIEREINGELKEFFEKLEKEEIISKNPSEQASFLNELEKHLNSFKEIKLEIAFSPTDDVIEKISQWLQKELGQKVILDLIINPKITGGAIIEYQGRWADFSIAKKINELPHHRATELFGKDLTKSLK